MIAVIIICAAVIICCAVEIFTLVRAGNPETEPQSGGSIAPQADYVYSIPAESTGTTWLAVNGSITAVQNAEG